MIPVIAIDGPAGSGKGTMARRLASHFGFAYLDTGMLYRTVAYMNYSLDELSKLSIADLQSKRRKISDKKLRTDEISMRTSVISKSTDIREKLTELQRKFIKHPPKWCKGVILDGRDIGTVIAPNAVCKLFITADIEVRAKRRFKQMCILNTNITFEDVYNNLQLRDQQDASRTVAPMQYNDSYTVIDTSVETVITSFNKAVEAVNKALKAAGIKIQVN